MKLSDNAKRWLISHSVTFATAFVMAAGSFAYLNIDSPFSYDLLLAGCATALRAGFKLTWELIMVESKQNETPSN